MATAHRTATALAITAALALGVSGCGEDGNAAPKSTTTTTTKSAQQDAFAKSEQTLRQLEKQIPEDGPVSTNLMTPDLLAETNDFRKQVRDHGARLQGTGKIVSITPMQYGTRPKPTTSMRVCTVGDVRIIDKATGRDLTQTQDHKPKPKGPSRDAAVWTLESNDGGKTFQANGMTLDGKC